MVNHYLEIKGKRAEPPRIKFTARLGDVSHVDTFDPEVAFHRRNFRNAVIEKFSLGDNADESVESQIMAAAANADESGSLFKPVVTMLDTVKPEKVEWLLPGKIAIGKNNLLCGDPGQGKSLVALAIAAAVSRGAPFPSPRDATIGKGGVAILTMEDDAADTIVPRLMAHGADLSRIALVEGATEIDGEGNKVRGIDLLHDIDLLKSAIQQIKNCRLVIIDTLSDYLGIVDSHKNPDVRAIMNPLAAMANEFRIANLGICHFRKSEGRAVHAVTGSIAFVGQSRVAWAITRCPTNPRRRLMTAIKNNLSEDNTGLAFQIEPLGPNGEPTVAWEGEPLRMTADQAMAPPKPKGGRPADDRDAAAEWLQLELAEGPLPASDVLSAAEGRGFNARTVRRAFEQLGGKPRKVGFRGGWSWSLPEDDIEDSTFAYTDTFSPLGNLRPDPGQTLSSSSNKNCSHAKGTDCEGMRANGSFDESVPF